MGAAASLASVTCIVNDFRTTSTALLNASKIQAGGLYYFAPELARCGHAEVLAAVRFDVRGRDALDLHVPMWDQIALHVVGHSLLKRELWTLIPGCF